MRYEIIHDDNRMHMSVLKGGDYYVMFSSQFYSGVADVTVAVGSDLDHVLDVMRDLNGGVYKITGNGSLKPLAHVLHYMLNDFKDLCIRKGLKQILLVPSDSRRLSAYSYVERYGFSFVDGKGFVMSLQNI